MRETKSARLFLGVGERALLLVAALAFGLALLANLKLVRATGGVGFALATATASTAAALLSLQLVELLHQLLLLGLGHARLRALGAGVHLGEHVRELVVASTDLFRLFIFVVAAAAAARARLVFVRLVRHV